MNTSTSTTLYRFRLDLSDIERGVYELLDFRIAMHPSESFDYLLTRVFAYALNYQEGLEFSPSGLSDPDAPALWIHPVANKISLWIEIGNPSPKKLHKASKSAQEVKVYTYKDPHLIVREAQNKEIHRAEQISISAFKPDFLSRLSKKLVKDSRWNVLYNDRILTVSLTDAKGIAISEETEVQQVKLVT